MILLFLTRVNRYTFIVCVFPFIFSELLNVEMKDRTPFRNRAIDIALRMKEMRMREMRELSPALLSIRNYSSRGCTL